MIARRVVVCGIGAACSFASAVEPLYSNGSADPAVPGLAALDRTGSGVPAPAGAMWSECGGTATAANFFAGFSCHPDSGIGAAGSFRFADDFEVTSPNGWRVSRVSFFAYSPGAPAGVSPFASVSLRIWNGRPGTPGVLVAMGDAATNRLAAASSTATYRVFNTTPLPTATPPDQTRLIWRVDADASDVFLAPGRYWLEWQVACTDPNAGAYVPPVTVAGSRGAAGANALQLVPEGFGLGWIGAVDPGKPALAPDVAQDFPFIVWGEALAIPCPADFNQDGGVDGQDVETFMRAWAAADVRADTNLDGGVDGADVETFFLVWQAGGC